MTPVDIAALFKTLPNTVPRRGISETEGDDWKKNKKSTITALIFSYLYG